MICTIWPSWWPQHTELQNCCAFPRWTELLNVLSQTWCVFVQQLLFLQQKYRNKGSMKRSHIPFRLFWSVWLPAWIVWIALPDSHLSHGLIEIHRNTINRAQTLSCWNGKVQCLVFQKPQWTLLDKKETEKRFKMMNTTLIYCALYDADPNSKWPRKTIFSSVQCSVLEEPPMLCCVCRHCRKLDQPSRKQSHKIQSTTKKNWPLSGLLWCLNIWSDSGWLWFLFSISHFQDVMPLLGMTKTSTKFETS